MRQKLLDLQKQLDSLSAYWEWRIEEYERRGRVWRRLCQVGEIEYNQVERLGGGDE